MQNHETIGTVFLNVSIWAIVPEDFPGHTRTNKAKGNHTIPGELLTFLLAQWIYNTDIYNNKTMPIARQFFFIWVAGNFLYIMSN